MRIRKVANEGNVVSDIDEFIMELTYLKNGNVASAEKLKRGIEIIDLIISISENTNENVVEKEEETIRFNPFHNRKPRYSARYLLVEYKVELEQAKKNIKKFI